LTIPEKAVLKVEYDLLIEKTYHNENLKNGNIFKIIHKIKLNYIFYSHSFM